ncbi:hypothetical protein [uncultured Acetatifactor sp.]|uniref:hypothetical protein n=1 Tax=uncultured Acetatifactor sp. TaxID=1671927 RepID=UPI0026378223|nr:hypothetical protein [uncultured Acetatifactor sp.]
MKKKICLERIVSYIFLQGIKILFFSALFLSILICFIFSGLDYARKCNYMPNFILVIYGMTMLAGIYMIIQIVSEIKCGREICLKTKFRLFLIGSFLFSLVQIFAIHNYYFKTDWDVSTIIRAAMDAADHKSMEPYELYFSQYPNNLFILFCYSIIIKMANFIGLRSYSYFCILVFQCMLCWLSGYLLFQIVNILERSYRKAVFAYAIWVLLIGISPWISIPYSDTMALVFPLLIFWIYLQNGRGKPFLFWKWFFIMFFSVIGYRLKPQVLILAISIGLICIFLSFHLKSVRGQMKKTYIPVIGLMMGLLASAVVNRAAIGSLDIEVDAEKAFGMTHYAMMGMNPDAKGVWAKEDVEFSASFETAEERSHMNMEKLKERLDAMGAKGVLRQLCYKTLTNYNDGTFCWGGEGSFYAELRGEKTIYFSALLRKIYYNRKYMGEFYPLWSNFAQSIWMAVLVLSLASVASKKEEVHTIMLSIVGITVFELIFEARARYLFIYVPFYIILAVRGASVLKWMCKNKFRERQNSQTTQT